MPLSYGTLSHLCASVAHESASPMPATNGRSTGDAAAHRPNAASTCTQAPASRAAAHTSAIGSIAPVFTLPTWMQTRLLLVRLGRRSARMRPCASVGTRVTRSRPSPLMPNALSMEAWISSPTTTSMGGAPKRPCASTSHPRRPHSVRRAAHSALKFAAVAEVTKPVPQLAGRPNKSIIHFAATSSSLATIGVIAMSPEF